MDELIGNLATALNTLLDRGGPTMIALGFLSLAVVAVFLVRVLALLFAGSGGIVQSAVRCSPQRGCRLGPI